MVEYEQESVVLIQSCLLIGYWFPNLQDRTQSWHWTGIAISTVQTIGLHRNPDAKCHNGLLSSATRRLWKNLGGVAWRETCGWHMVPVVPFALNKVIMICHFLMGNTCCYRQTRHSTHGHGWYKQSCPSCGSCFLDGSDCQLSSETS